MAWSRPVLDHVSMAKVGHLMCKIFNSITLIVFCIFLLCNKTSAEDYKIIASIGYSIGEDGGTVYFQGSVAFVPDKEGMCIVSYEWDFGDGDTSTEQNPMHRFNAVGNYSVSLKATDNSGRYCTNQVNIEVTPNLAYGVNVTASSCFNDDYSPNNAVDGVYGVRDGNEWASSGELNPWIDLRWNSAITINKVMLYNRCNPVDHIWDARLYFYRDGNLIKSIHIGMLPYEGLAKEIVFDQITIDEIKLDVTDGVGQNIGLSEIMVFYDPNHGNGNLTQQGGCTASASSEYNGYPAGNAIDGKYGVWGEYEWAGNKQLTPKLTIKWDEPQKINKVVLYDRSSSVKHICDHIKDAWIYLRKGGSEVKSIHIGMLPYGGAAYEIVLDSAITIDEIYLDITEGEGANVGLSEIMVF